MCTAISENKIRHLFGRTLDLEYSYNEAVVISPRNFSLNYIHERASSSHLAMIGTAHISKGIPLYYDAINEAGLAAAALNFPQKAVYNSPRQKMHNIASFEVIPWILGQCDDIDSAISLLKNTNITSDDFSTELRSTPLHWLIADSSRAITIEPLSDRLMIYENPFGVLTNSPEFPYHLSNVSNFMQTSPYPAKNNLCPSIELKQYSRGMGAIGLPGDFSSASRFVRAVFAKSHTTHGESENAEINRFFHIMDTVSVPNGCIFTTEGKAVRTIYISCADTESLIYYFSTYNCRQIRAVSLFANDLDSSSLSVFSMERAESIDYLSE